MLPRLFRQAASSGALRRLADVRSGVSKTAGGREFAASNKADVKKVVAVLYKAGDAAKEPKLLGEYALSPRMSLRLSTYN
jgi:hypothetical protein